MTELHALPGHLADWTVLINEQTQVPVSSLELAHNSKHFYEEFRRMQEVKAALSGASGDRVSRVTYDHPEGLMLMLRLMGCSATPGGMEEGDSGRDGAEPSDELGPDNLAGLVRAAIHFQAPKMLDMALSAAHSQTSLTNCWRYWRAAVQSNWHPLRALVQSAIAAVFQPASAQPEFLSLTEAELLSFLRHRQLNVASELDLLEPIARWLDGHPSSGPATVANLLSAVRQNRLTPAETREFERCPLLARCEPNRAAELLAATAAVQAGEMLPPRVPHEVIFVCGGWEGLQNDPNFGPSDAVQVYNYQERTWIRHSQAPGPVLRCGHAYSGCVLLGQCVYIVGGYVQNRATGSQGPTAGVKEYDLRRRSWRLRAPMHHQRNYVSAAALDGFVYAVGGHNGRVRLNSAERYNPKTNRWQMIAQLLQIRSDAGCAGLQGHLYVCGGFNGHQFFSSVERYDPAADQWTYVMAMHSVRSGVSVCECEGMLYALGGNNGNSRLATVERYDPELNQWSAMPQMLTQRSNFSAALLRGEIYAIGGWSDQTNTTVSVVERWRPGPNAGWELAPNLLLPASANCCCEVVGLDLVEGLLVPTEASQLPQQQQLANQEHQPPQQEQDQHHRADETAEFESSSN